MPPFADQDLSARFRRASKNDMRVVANGYDEAALNPPTMRD